MVQTGGGRLRGMRDGGSGSDREDIYGSGCGKGCTSGRETLVAVLASAVLAALASAVLAALASEVLAAALASLVGRAGLANSA